MKREEQIDREAVTASDEHLKGCPLRLRIIYACGFANGAKWADEHTWISVEEELPEMYEDVIVLNNGKPIMSRRHWVDKWNPTPTIWLWSKSLINVTHWMPIPKLEKGGEK